MPHQPAQLAADRRRARKEPKKEEHKPPGLPAWAPSLSATQSYHHRRHPPPAPEPPFPPIPPSAPRRPVWCCAANPHISVAADQAPSLQLDDSIFRPRPRRSCVFHLSNLGARFHCGCATRPLPQTDDSSCSFAVASGMSLPFCLPARLLHAHPRRPLPSRNPQLSTLRALASSILALQCALFSVLIITSSADVLHLDFTRASLHRCCLVALWRRARARLCPQRFPCLTHGHPRHLVLHKQQSRN